MGKTLIEIIDEKYNILEELRQLETKAILERGCYCCDGKIEIGSYAYMISTTKPCSEGSLHADYRLCLDCFNRVAGELRQKGA